MSTPASLKEHPIHPMLVGIPIGLWVFSIMADFTHLSGWGGAVWKDVAHYAIGAAIAGALIAAVPGFIDLTSISDKSVRRVAIFHMALNLVTIALFAASFWLRLINPLDRLPVGVSGLGILLLSVAGWLGGELVYVHHMGMTDQPTDSNTSSRVRDRRVA